MIQLKQTQCRMSIISELIRVCVLMEVIVKRITPVATFLMLVLLTIVEIKDFKRL